MDNHPLTLPQPSHLPQGLSLQAILSAFNNPISEEQAWALCHQLVKHIVQELQLEAYELQNDQLNQRNKLPTINSLEDVIILKDGNLSIRENRRPSSAKPASTSTTKFLSSLGGILFKALDYGLSEQEEPILSPSLEKLIECLADDSVLDNGHPDDGNLHAVDSCDPDEGIERDAGESEPLDNNNHNAHENHNHQSHHLSHRMSLQYVLESCVSRIRSLSTTSTSSSPSSLLSSPSSMSSNDRYRQAESHYRAVCRALVVEADELMAFLTQVSKGTKELKETCHSLHLAGVRDSPLDFLESTDWARLWMQVMRELRNGVNRLNHVDSAASQTPRLHEYELTPYEMLLEDIRSKSYTLRHVVPSEDHITQRVKKDAHEMILDFIRSRPPLKPADQRRLSTPVKSSNLHEQLMNSIKKERTLKPLPRMARLRASLKECGVPLGRVVTPSPEPPREMGSVHPITSTPVRRKKLIKADLDVKLSIGLEDDFDISDTKLNESDAIDALKSEFYQSLTISNGHRDMDSSGIASSPTNTTRSIEGRGRGNWAFPRLRRLFAFF